MAEDKISLNERARKPLPVFDITFDRESDDRWIAEVPALPGAIVYAQTKEEAEKQVRQLAYEILAERVENDEAIPEPVARMFRVIDWRGPLRG